MKIAITGTRGVPNNYGGFEQCAENLAVLLAEAGHEVTVYNPHYHAYNQPVFNKVKITKCWNPEKKFGTAGNFIYDYLCMKDALKNNCDILLALGYTTSSVFFPFLKKRKSVLVTNMDGLEWKRDKWNSAVKKLAKWFESLGARYSDFLVADNNEIKKYLENEYKKKSTYIGYGAEIFEKPDESALKKYSVNVRNYDVLIARLEKENNIETILDGIVLSGSTIPFLVIGNHLTGYGEVLKSKYRNNGVIKFIGGIYNQSDLNNIRYYSRFYFHGHSVGGTNPSLLEAMAAMSYIIAHDNPFNRDVLQQHALYFADPAAIKNLLTDPSLLEKNRLQFIDGNAMRIKEHFNWKKIAGEYEALFKEVLNKKL